MFFNILLLFHLWRILTPTIWNSVLTCDWSFFCNWILLRAAFWSAWSFLLILLFNGVLIVVFLNILKRMLVLLLVAIFLLYYGVLLTHLNIHKTVIISSGQIIIIKVTYILLIKFFEWSPVIFFNLRLLDKLFFFIWTYISR